MVELRLLGPLDIVRDGEEAPALIAHPKRLALLAFLALTPPPGFRRRDSLVAIFWPELGDAHARAALRQAVHVIRRTLGDALLVSRGSEELGVDRRLLWCDAVAFAEDAAAGRYDDALALYVGPLLDGFFLSAAPQFEEWLEERRSSLGALAARGAWSLAANAARAGDGPLALQWARRAFAFTPDDESALARLLGILVDTGDRCGAIREYERFARRLRRDYGIDPAPATAAVVRGTATGTPVMPRSENALTMDVRELR
ncbi:MAG: hypothetical protein HOQ09_05870 [Gemmatimonadaceae bacterium]|nr:hypothetical protein [Gemmatimonadaceae bacterium]